MHTTIMTRGKPRGDEYSYFPPMTGDSWWRKYRDETSFEHPTLLLEAGPGEWRLYAGGIPSNRRDSTSTRIQYSCILTGESTDSDDVRTAQSLVWAWSHAARREDLGRVLDQWTTEDTVAEWFQSSARVPSADDVAHAVADAIRQASDEMIDPPSASPRSVEYPKLGGVVGMKGSSFTRVGGLTSSGGTQTLLTAAVGLLQGEISGCALVLNLVNFSKQEPSKALRSLVSPIGSYTLILDMSSSEPIREVVPIHVTEVMPGPKVTWLRFATRKIASLLAGVRSFPAFLYRILFKKA
ncbi:MAG: hypothetical protein ACT4NY_30730 [Pseudonocardiales bacterium]